METKLKKIKSISKVNRELTVDIEVENTHSYQTKTGWVVHNTVSALVDTASGIHPRHSDYYIRTVRSDKKDPICKMMIDIGFPYEDEINHPDSVAVFSFPLASPKNAVIRTKVTALEQMELWFDYQKYYCEHKPSVTINVKEHEWLAVGDWVYQNYESISGLSFLPFSDHIYQQAPFSDCDKQAYDELQAKMPKTVNWENLNKYEKTDTTTGMQNYACTADACSIL